MRTTQPTLFLEIENIIKGLEKLTIEEGGLGE